MHLNEAGIMIREIWKNLPRRFPTVELDVFVVMPNHIHGILQIHEPVGASLVGALDGNPGSEVTAGATDGDRAATRAAPTGVALGGVIGAYKSITTVEYTRGVIVRKMEAFQRASVAAQLLRAHCPGRGRIGSRQGVHRQQSASMGIGWRKPGSRGVVRTAVVILTEAGRSVRRGVPCGRPFD